MTHPGFLRAICEDPDDDAHRLIYADWLDDHGDADRAEFVRLQCALAAIDDEDEAMKTREAELLREHGEAWVAELPVVPRVMWNSGFRRGFVETVVFPNYMTWRNHGVAMLDAAPVETVNLGQVTPNTVRRLARSPGIERVRGLEFPTGNFSNLELEVLGKSCRLKTFCYWGTATSDRIYGRDAGRILATNPGFKGLRTLSLGNISFGDEGAALLASAPNLTALETLRIGYCTLSPIGAKLLTKHASWPRLRTLCLNGNHVGDSGARELASSPALTGLRVLLLSESGVGEAGATALARSMFLTNLTSLQLSGCPIGSEGLRALATSTNLRSLRVLVVSNANLTGRDVVALLRSPLGGHLSVLNVQGCPFDAETAAVIVATPGLQNLERLLVDTGPGDESLLRRFGGRITIF